MKQKFLAAKDRFIIVILVLVIIMFAVCFSLVGKLQKELNLHEQHEYIVHLEAEK